MARATLITTNLAPGGAETQVFQLALALRRRAWDLAVVSLLPASAFSGELAAAGVEFASLGMRPGRPDPRALARLAAILRRLRPQVLHGHMFHANVTSRLARLFCPVPVVISTIHSAAESSRGSDRIRLRDFIYRATDPLADLVVAVSKAAADRHATAGAISGHKLRVIPNGVDTVVFRPDPARRERLRRELGVGSSFVWLGAGRLHWKKDYPTMLRALAGQTGAVLLVAGEGPQEPALRTLAAELEVDARFLGRRDDMPALMNVADGMLLSSVVEGLPMVLLEAAASGLPAVATIAGGSGEAVIEGETGYLAPPRDATALGAAMSRLASLPPAARDAMSRAARTHAIARFDIESVAAEWDRTYRELLEKARRWM